MGIVIDCQSKIIDFKEPLPPIRIPMPAENRRMIEYWHNSMHSHMQHWKILDFDPQYQIFWVEIIPPVSPQSIWYVVEIGCDCYWYLKEMREAKKTKWQFPCLLPNRKSIQENPLPPQYLYDYFDLDLRFWDEEKDLQLFLEEFNSYYDNHQVDGQWCWLSSWHREFNYELGDDGAWVYTINNNNVPLSAGILFEFGVRMAHAIDTNFWNLPVPPPQPMGAVLVNSVADLTKQLNLYLGLPANTFERDKRIVELRGLILKQTIIDKMTALRDLSTRRPLLIREKIELDFLQKIQAADTLEVLQAAENELNNTAIDPELKTRLLKNISEKKAFY